ncbi:hypothetical protein HNO89_001021 [Sporosarcina luteola]|nr:hypothetical protein [Sporosarcina luteola]
MSTVLTKSTLDILREYQTCEISIIFNDEHQVPYLSVSYIDNLYVITNLRTNIIETYRDVESVITSIIEELNV